MSTFLQIAFMIDTFMHDYDPYEYGDCIEDAEQFVQQLSETITIGDVQYLIDWFQAVIEEHDDYEQEAQNIAIILRNYQCTSVPESIDF